MGRSCCRHRTRDQIDKKEIEKPPFSTLKKYRHDFPAIKSPELFACRVAAISGRLLISSMLKVALIP